MARLDAGRAGALGFATLTAAMAMLIGADRQVFLPVGVVGAFLCLASMALFLVILVQDASRSGHAGRSLRRPQVLSA